MDSSRPQQICIIHLHHYYVLVYKMETTSFPTRQGGASGSLESFQVSHWIKVTKDVRTLVTSQADPESSIQSAAARVHKVTPNYCHCTVTHTVEASSTKGCVIWLDYEICLVTRACSRFLRFGFHMKQKLII